VPFVWLRELCIVLSMIVMAVDRIVIFVVSSNKILDFENVRMSF